MQPVTKVLLCVAILFCASFVEPEPNYEKKPSSYSSEREEYRDSSIPLPPTNKEINKALDSASEYLEKAKDVASDKLSPEAQREKEKIVEDLQDVLDSARTLIEKKNRGDLLQKFILHSGQAIKQVATEAAPKTKDYVSDDLSRLSSQIETELVKRKANRILSLSRSLIFQTLRSEEFRNLLSDFSDWFHQGLLAPLIDTGKETIDKVTETGTEAAGRLVDTGKETIEKLSETAKTLNKEKGIDAAKSAYDTYEEASSAASKLKEHGMKAAFDLKERLTESLMDPERREQVTKEFYVLWSRIQKDPKLREAVKQLFELVDILKEEALKVKESLQETAQKAKEIGSEAVETELINQAITDAKQLLNQLLGVPAGQQSPLDDLAEGLRDLFFLVNEDEQTHKFFTQAKYFLLRSLDQPELLLGMAEETAGMPGKGITRETQMAAHHHKQHGQEILSNAGQVFSSLRYGRPTQKLIQSWKRLAGLVRDDPVGNRFASSLRRLLKDIALDVTEAGSLSFNLATITRMKEWLVPLITDALSNITLPALYGSTDTYDYSLEGLKLSSALIRPENVHVTTTEDLDLDIENVQLERIHANVSLHINNIKTSLHDAKFAFKRKWFPRFSDEGVIDLELAGEGTSLVIDMKALYHLDRPTEFTVTNIECHVDKLLINVKEAHHKWLYNLIRNLFSTAIKNRFESSVEESLWNSVNELSSNWKKFSNIASETIENLKEKPKEVFSCVVDEVVDKAQKLATGRAA